MIAQSVASIPVIMPSSRMSSGSDEVHAYVWYHSGMAVSDFATKAAVVVRDDLVPWQRLNVTAFLVSGIIGAAEPEAIGEAYEDADGVGYLPLLVQPLLVFE